MEKDKAEYYSKICNKLYDTGRCSATYHALYGNIKKLTSLLEESKELPGEMLRKDHKLKMAVETLEKAVEAYHRIEKQKHHD